MQGNEQSDTRPGATPNVGPADTISSRFTARIDRLIGADLSAAPPDVRRSARLIFAFAAISAVAVCVFLVSRVPLGHTSSELLPMLAAFGAAVAALVIVRHSRHSFAFAGNVLVLSWLLASAWLMFIRGGINSQPTVVLASIPFLATTLVGKRSGVAWMAVFIAVAWAYVHYDSSRLLYDHVPGSQRAVANLLGTGVFALVLLSMALANESLRATAARELEVADRERRDAESAARLLRADRLASVGQMVASLAHEINNPLMYVQGNLDFISEEATLDDSCREALADAIEGAYRVSAIVRDLKTFARADEEQVRAVDLRKVVQSTMRMVEGQIRARGSLETSFGACPPVEGSETRLGQVVLNLLVNAVQATQEGRSDNQITLELGTRDGWAEVVVADRGVGITPDNLSRVTEPFFTTKPVGVGTGLGLAVCRSIIERHGGKFEIESVVGEGTQVTIMLPPATATTRTTGSVPAIEHPDTPPRKVLVIDDDPIIAKTLRRTLRGHELTVCSRGREALELLGNGASFDLVLCDLMMPEMTGMDVHTELEGNGSPIASTMVFITGGAFGPDARDFLDTVPNRRLQKPLDKQELAELLANPALDEP